MRLSASAQRVLSMVVFCTATIWLLAAGPARADTAPSNTVLPTISGTAQQGDALTASPGTWSGDDPITYTYEWSDGQTGSTATLSGADVAQSLTVTVTASNPFGEASATSESVGPVLPAAPENGDPPQISGTAQQGETLSVSDGTWSNGPTAFSYVWEDCDSMGSNCTPIAGAVSSSYTLQSSDVGSRVVAVVTASNAGGQNSSSSAASASVLPAAPADRIAPGISGAAQQGHTLTVSNGTWDNNPTSFGYAWQGCDGAGTNCSAISGATRSTYTVQASDVGMYVRVTVTASNSGGHTSETTASVGPALPPAPLNTHAPVITGTAERGYTLSVSNGTWSNSPTGYSYAWENCNASGSSCTPIGGATWSSYALSAADVGSAIVCVVTATGAGGSASVTTAKTAVVVASPIPVASQPTTTDLLATPSAPVTNQGVTLIATVTAGASSTALWGTVTVENGEAAIGGCANMPAVPSGGSATVACSTSFVASTAQLSAVFTPASGSILEGSASPGGRLTIGPDASSTSLDAAPAVNLGASTTYTATVGPPAARPGPVQPTGWVEFLDGGQLVGSCASQPLAGGAATCTVSYAVAGAHQITARYSGDPNFTSSSSPAAQVSAVPVPTSIPGTITSTMQWSFYFTPTYTLVRNLVVNGANPGATVDVRCHGHGCPFARNATVLAKSKRCGPKARTWRKVRTCYTRSGSFNLTLGFAGRRLAVGAQIAINIVQPGWVGKTYRFTIRSRRGPRVRVGCLAPDGTFLAVGC